MAINWIAIEDALELWVRQSLAFTEGQVRWADQNADEPSDADHAVIRIGPIVSAAGPDNLEVRTDLAQASGQEIEHRSLGYREIAVNVQVFTDEVHGGSRAQALLDRARTRLHLPGVREGLFAAGLVPLRLGGVLNLTALEDSDMEGRASLDVTFVTTVTESERSGYIATVEVTHVESGSKTVISS